MKYTTSDYPDRKEAINKKIDLILYQNLKYTIKYFPPLAFREYL